MTWLKLGLVSVLSTSVLAACVKKEQPEHEQHAASEVQTASEPEMVLQDQPQIEEIPTEEPSAQITLSEVPSEQAKAAELKDTNAPAAVEVTPNTASKAEEQPATTASTHNTTEEDPLAQVMKAAQPALKPAQPAAEQQ